MSGQRNVAVVDAYSSAKRLTPLFRERGFSCIRVQSQERIPAIYAPSFVIDDFAANVVHRGESTRRRRWLRRMRPSTSSPGPGAASSCPVC